MKYLYKFIALFILPFFYNAAATAQVVLNANGPGDTYELINSVLAPGYNAVESPDISHPAFGRHIAEVFDIELNKHVFEFYSHVTPDNDPSTTSTDRQRVEIKTYDQSPANLIGIPGETVTYKWRFRIPVGYQPSATFSHLHQIKPVNGDDDDPLFTLTARKGSPNKLELIYVASSSSGTTKPAVVDLSLFEGRWVEVTEKIEIGAAGKYSISIKRVSDGTVLLSYYNPNIATIRPDNSFIRPKWGIYRSIATPADLRDEAVRFSDFSITEGAAVFSQTYFWVGNIAQTSFSSTGNWNTQLDGSGDSRTVAGAQPDDILIIDGSNVGGSILPPVTGTVTVTIASTAANTFAQLKLQNNAIVLMQRPTGGGGTGLLSIGGDGTSDPDLLVPAGSSITINSSLTDGNVNINLANPATGLVGGVITITNTGTHRITSQTTNGLVFTTGSTFNSAATPASTAYPFGSNSQGVQNGVLFEAGSNLIVTGNRSPMGGTSTFQSCNMQPGSNTYFRSNASSASGSWANLKTYGNVFIQNNASFTSDGPFYKIDSLTIDNGCTLTTHNSGNTPVLGNLTVNGTLTSPAGGTNVIVMGGSVPQTISGSGTITVSSLTVANNSDVTLSKSIAIANTCNIFGKINFGTSNQITGAGAFSSRVLSTAVTVTGNTTAGSYQLTGTPPATLSGNTGLVITGTGLSPNTNVVGFSSSNNTINLSKPALSTTTGSTFTFSSDSATITTANVNGLDSLTGSVVVTGSKSFSSGTNYIINAATSRPIGISSGNTTGMLAGNVTLNAPVTTNYRLRIRGTLTLNSGILTIRALDTIRISSGNAIAGSPFSSTKYIVSARTGNDLGVLRIDGFTTARNFPVGTSSNFLPVSLTPTAAMDFAVSAFEGTTVDGTPGGTPQSAADKDKSVDATWIVNRINGTGDCNLQLGWTPALEGMVFSGLGDANIGISRYDGAMYETSIGTGDNTANTASALYTNFSPFIVTSKLLPLPVQLRTITVLRKNNASEITWEVENEENILQYIVERMDQQNVFASIGAVNATRSRKYSFVDAAVPTAKIVYYRLKVIGLSGYVKYSNVVVVRYDDDLNISVYPNPVTDIITITGLSGNSEIRMMNATGQVVLMKKTLASIYSMNIAAMKPGIYMMEIVSDNGKKSFKKIIKQ
jgi:Secretion system C-terminal sorting domain